jgi:NADPH-dependent glutamate synthase beta subunit-like oxidoreductase
METQSLSQPTKDIPPCQAACPISTDARGYVLLTAAERFDEAHEVARANNPLLATCARACSVQCEAACRRGELDRPIAIRRIKRFLDERIPVRSQSESRAASTGKSVAIIGCGPAGLSAAHELALLGHRVTIFDAASTPGGMAALGIPRFRLPPAAIERDVAEIRSLGVVIRSGARVGRDIQFGEIRQGFDAIFLAAGAFRPNRLDIPGARLRGVFEPLPWLRQANLGVRPEAACGERVVVIGGGYTAMDTARTALRMGAGEVSIYYRRTRHEMEVHEEELEETKEEGVAIHFLASPLRVLSADGKRAAGVEFVRNELGEMDESGRRRPLPVPGSQFSVEADTVIAAIGQSPDLSFVDEGLSVRRGFLCVDAETMQTSSPGVFAGGDCLRGPRTIVEAIADGKRAAAGIHRYLGFQIRADASSAPVLDPPQRGGLFEGVWLSRRSPAMPRSDAAWRRAELHREVEPALDEATAATEALRCLYCGLQPRISIEECSLCGACLGICPEDCIRPATAIGVDGDPVWAGSTREAVGFAIDETRCIRCGACVRVCPQGAIGFPELSVRRG